MVGSGLGVILPFLPAGGKASQPGGFEAGMAGFADGVAASGVFVVGCCSRCASLR